MNELWKSRMTRRIVVVLLILATALALYAFSAVAAPLPPRRTMKPWPPAPPARYYCQPGNPRPPAFCLRYVR